MKALLFTLIFTAVAWPQIIYHPRPATAGEFPLMSWYTSPSDPAQLNWMKEAGLNISGFCRPDDLDRVAAAGLMCFVDDKRVNGYDWDKLPPETEIRKNLKTLARETASKPAVLGYLLRDEPGAGFMPGLGKVAALVREIMPGKLPYVNLFPTYASNQQLGTSSYPTYVTTYLDTFRPEFVSWDNYSIIGGVMLDRFFTNMEIIRRMSQAAGKPFWNCIMANASFNFMEPSDATFNLQVYSTLAYGGRGIQYFTYFTPPVGNYRLGAVDQFGNKTATWDALRRINSQVHALAPTLLKLKSTGVYHFPDVPAEARPLSESRLVKSVSMTQAAPNPSQPRFLIGELEDDQARPYLMIVNKDMGGSYTFEIELKQPGRKLFYVSPYSGAEEPFTGEQNWLAPGAGILLRVGGA